MCPQRPVTSGSYTSHASTSRWSVLLEHKGVYTRMKWSLRHNYFTVYISCSFMNVSSIHTKSQNTRTFLISKRYNNKLWKDMCVTVHVSLWKRSEFLRSFKVFWESCVQFSLVFETAKNQTNLFYCHVFSMKTWYASVEEQKKYLFHPVEEKNLNDD